jgi:hypothetical protein
VEGAKKKGDNYLPNTLWDNFTSGWNHDHGDLLIIDSAKWNQKVRDLAQQYETEFPKHSCDKNRPDGWNGKYHASHAKAKLIAFYMDFREHHHLALDYLKGSIGESSLRRQQLQFDFYQPRSEVIR